MTSINFEAMREEIRRILNSIDERDISMDSAIDELLNLHIVSNCKCPKCGTVNITITDDLMWCYECEKSYDY